MRISTPYFKWSGFMLVTLVFVFSLFASPVSALSEAQKKAFQSGIYYYNVGASKSACDQDSTLIGSVNEEKIFNFFIGKGLSHKQAAGAFGNIMHESSGDPENIQNPAGKTKDPSNLSGGWGIIQWTPGSKIIGLAEKAGITTPIYELATQLELVWQHMNNNPVVTKPFDLAYYKTLSDYKEATAYFEDKIEGAGVVALDSRQKFARNALVRYGSGLEATDVSADTNLCSTDSSGEIVGNFSLPLAKKWYTQHPSWFTKPHHDYPAADIPVRTGTPVYSISAGTIISAPTGDKCGQGIKIDAGQGVSFVYCHGSDGGSVSGAKQGDTVKPGQLIMHSGYSGHVDPAGPAGAHLHLGIELEGKSVCPQNLLVGIANGSAVDIKSLPERGCTY